MSSTGGPQVAVENYSGVVCEVESNTERRHEKRLSTRDPPVMGDDTCPDARS
jgi:hypothetical protein